jgi:pimeloyl-ACP methyl ester carboxylesterase
MLEALSGTRSAPSPDMRSVERALRERVAHPSARTAQRRFRFVFDAGAEGAWTVDVDRGKATLVRGRLARPTATVTGDAVTLNEVLDGRVAGVEAFLEGRLQPRGNLSLMLELDDLLPPARRNPRFPRCHRVKADGLGTFYVEAGVEGAPKVVLLHGLGATSASFLTTLWDLSRDHHVFAVDLPGFGESDKPMRRLQPAFFAQWLEAFLDAVGIERAHLVGNSMGGRVALELALRSPERVDRLALLAPSMAWRRYRAAAGLVQWMRPELAAVPLPVLHRSVLAFIRSLFVRPDRVPEGAVLAAADEFVRVFTTARGRIAFFHAAREIYLESPHGTHGFWDRLPGLTPPALFLFGERDWLVPRAFARHVLRAVPSATCETLPDCGHVPQYELPALTNARIRAFFTEPVMQESALQGSA